LSCFLAAFSPQRSKSLDFSLFDVLGEVALSIWCWLRACHFLQSSRTEAQRPIFRLPVGTRPGCAAKAAQTADTGATGWDWRFVCAINLCSQ